MFTDFRNYPWVLEPYCYATEKILLAEPDRMVIAPAEAKDLTRKKRSAEAKKRKRKR
jgi:hypothetical protein